MFFTYTYFHIQDIFDQAPCEVTKTEIFKVKSKKRPLYFRFYNAFWKPNGLYTDTHMHTPGCSEHESEMERQTEEVGGETEKEQSSFFVRLIQNWIIMIGFITTTYIILISDDSDFSPNLKQSNKSFPLKDTKQKVLGLCSFLPNSR